VPDSLDGRFETLALHVFLVAYRLKSASSAVAPSLSRALLETFVTDMDRSLREMGVTDLGVGRRVKAMTEGLYGRIKAYEAALAESDDAALGAALRRNLYGTLDEAVQKDVAAVARYVRRQHEALAAQPVAELLAGRVRFTGLAEAIGPEFLP
jgi:cytochrome b pre-mRNA-processing protein 3